VTEKRRACLRYRGRAALQPRNREMIRALALVTVFAGAGHCGGNCMRLGMVGLGRMGANMARRLIRGGHEVVVTDLSPDAVKGMAAEGAAPSSSLEDFASQLGSPHIAWLMVPAEIGRASCRERV